MTDLFQPLTFASGATLKNRFMLAPLTNHQSHADGTLSDDEFNWLTLRAKGGFAATMTCAAHVQKVGQGFPGQLGLFSDDHLPGLTRLAAAIKAQGSIALTQPHHAGFRSPPELIGQNPVAPSDDEKSGARALSGAEVEQLTEDFIEACVRSEKAGFDGVEIHGAHSYIICAFLSPTLNRRTDAWGGSVEKRAKLVFDILAGVRARCRPGFILGLRLSPERYGLVLSEMLEVAQEALSSGHLDFLDMSLWDVRKAPEDEAMQGRPLIDYFAELKRGATRLGAAGMINSAADARWVIEQGLDFPIIGRGAILHHDFPKKVQADPNFRQAELPVTGEYLKAEGLGPAFIAYMRGRWTGFVKEEEAA